MTTQWQVLGEYFGYPDCCIAHFHERGEAFRRGEELLPIVVLPDTGYVACPLCAAAYTDEELIARIEERRLCDAPFPHGDSDELVRILQTREEDG